MKNPTLSDPLCKVDWSGFGYDALGRVTIPPGEQAVLQDPLNRNVQVSGMSLRTSLPDVVTFGSVTASGLPINVGSQEAASELLQTIPMDFKVNVGQSVRIVLFNHGIEPVVVSGLLHTRETWFPPEEEGESDGNP